MDITVTQSPVKTEAQSAELEKESDFSWVAYTQLYKDLHCLETEAAAYAHWLEHGKREGRIASLQGIFNKFGIEPNKFPDDFDWQSYIDLNPDLTSIVTNQWQAILHYCQFGMKGGRRYTKQPAEMAASNFDWQFYLWYNADIKDITSEAAAWKHWNDIGKVNGRLASPSKFYAQQGVDIHQLPKGFDYQEYLSLYPHLKDEGIATEWHAVSHFLKRPIAEQSVYSFKTLGFSFERSQKYAEAIEALEKAMKHSPNDIEIRVHLARILVLAKNWKRAASVYRKVSQSEQMSGWALYEFSRGLLQLIKGQVESAVEASRSAATEFLEGVERYHQTLKKSNSNIYGDDWHDFRDALDGLLENQMSVNAELAALKQVHQYIDSTFDFSEFVAFSSHDKPIVSIIIPVYNKIDYTIRCLKSLVQNVSDTLAIEVVVVNDCSSDETKEYLEEIEGLVLVNNARNLGFIHSCNAGAEVSKGEYLYFLNNDTEVLPDAIETLVDVFKTKESVGAVGSKLVYPTGALQEAGGIIWQDSSGWNYGRNENPLDPKYNFVRSVDYCSGASLLVKRETFESLDGFERDFAPAYYEDTDLCFAVRHQLGLEVMYQPKSVIIHYEGISSGTSTTSGIKRFQVVNSKKFKEKWASALAKHPVNEKGYEDAHRAARRFQGKKTVLVIDSYLPYYDKESGSRRLFQILKIFKELDYHVIFLPDDMRATEPYASELQSMEIEVLYTCDGFGTLPEEQLRERLPLIDIAWICRPGLMKRYLPVIRENTQIKVIYDTIDLHYLRMKRELELGLASEADQKAMSWVDMQALELKMAMRAELTLTVTHTEKEVLCQQGIDSVQVVPNIHFPYRGEKPSFDERSGILFIGGYNHPPNVDGVEWLCNEIMPIVWAKIPDIKVTLLGSSPSKKVKALGNERVDVPGYVADVSSYFLNSRVFVAPLRYGAGMKGKIGHSLEYGLPLVSTAIGVEGMNLTSGVNSMEANTTESFAQAILQLYADKQMWENISIHSEKAIEFYSPGAVKEVISGIVS